MISRSTSQGGVQSPRFFRFFAAVLAMLLSTAPQGGAAMLPHAETIKNLPRDGGDTYNRLVFEKSPYLLQHAANPVDWYPWGEEAFTRAREEDKPIFLSIGYSTCHWCHVMEHESFEDKDVAAALGKDFIAIKVDREERPDIDNIYMTVCQAMTGSGGWPLTIIMTPDKRPFFAGTYIPKEPRYGRYGLIDLLTKVAGLWKDNRDAVLQDSLKVVQALERIVEPAGGGAVLGEDVLRTAYAQAERHFDSTYGGFGDAPKFPTPHKLSLILRQAKRLEKPYAREIVEKTLRGFRNGGVYDQVGFGFHRYATDREFLLPHFEKMLYDQAMMAITLVETYQATGKEEFAATAREVFTYVMRDMTDPEGGFYSAEDADSEGVEGKFYVWSFDEVLQILGKEDGPFFAETFRMKPGGNFKDEATGEETGLNIPHLGHGRNLAEDRSPETVKRIDQAREKLFRVREQRVRPLRDDKIITGWNGLMIVALAKGGRILGDLRYTEAAEKAASYVLKNLRDDKGRLLRRARAGDAGIPGFVDDYAFFVWGLMELYESTFDPVHLKTALSLTDDMLRLFWDDTGGGLYFSGTDNEELLTRMKDIYDGAIPSGNSVAFLNLLRLGRITGKEIYEKKAEGILKTFSGEVKESPLAYTQFLVGLDFMIGPSQEIVIAGDPDKEDTKRLLSVVRRTFLPNAVVLLHGDDEAGKNLETIAPFTKNQITVDGKAAAYVCERYTCKRPVTDEEALDKLLTPELRPAT